jgi:hypothetical protein
VADGDQPGGARRSGSGQVSEPVEVGEVVRGDGGPAFLDGALHPGVELPRVDTHPAFAVDLERPSTGHLVPQI